MPVTPRGEDTVTALREWIAKDIKEAPKQIFELAKFLFGVSSGAIGILVTVSKFSNNTWTYIEWTSLAAFVTSAAMALYIAMPNIHKLSGSYDLARAHGRMVSTAWGLVITWGLVWTVAVILAGVGLLT